MRFAFVPAALAFVALLGCAYPRTIRVYDEDCQVTAREMVLDVTDSNFDPKCGTDTKNDCIAQLVGHVSVLAASTVISGSIVIAGSVVFWLEKRANCKPIRTLPQPTSPSS